MHSHLPNRQHQSGFTLVELLVATAIFALLMASIASLFTLAFNLQRRAGAAQHIEENAQLVTELISRQLRVGSVIQANGCGTTLSVTFADPVTGAPTTSAYAYDSVAKTITQNGVQLTSKDVQFTAFQFCVSGASASADGQQTRVTMPMTIQASVGQAQVSVSLQTTSSSRNLSPDLGP